MMTDELLTVEEVAARLRVNPETVRRWLRSGRLAGYRPVTDQAGWRVAKSDLERLLAQQRTEGE